MRSATVRIHRLESGMLPTVIWLRLGAQALASWFAAYNHCGPTTVRIHADVSGGGSTNDFHLCVGPGQTHLGAGGKQ